MDNSYKKLIKKINGDPLHVDNKNVKTFRISAPNKKTRIYTVVCESIQEESNSSSEDSLNNDDSNISGGFSNFKPTANSSPKKDPHNEITRAQYDRYRNKSQSIMLIKNKGALIRIPAFDTDELNITNTQSSMYIQIKKPNKSD